MHLFFSFLVFILLKTNQKRMIFLIFKKNRRGGTPNICEVYLVPWWTAFCQCYPFQVAFEWFQHLLNRSLMDPEQIYRAHLNYTFLIFPFLGCLFLFRQVVLLKTCKIYQLQIYWFSIRIIQRRTTQSQIDTANSAVGQTGSAEIRARQCQYSQREIAEWPERNQATFKLPSGLAAMPTWKSEIVTNPAYFCRCRSISAAWVALFFQ